MKTKIFLATTAIAIGLLPAGMALAKTQISWWHAMTGANSEVVEKIAADFNASQSDYELLPVFKGTYPETLNAGIAAFRAGQAPDIIQVFDVGTGVMMAAEGAIKPVAEVLTEAGMSFDKSQYLPGIVAYYSRPDGTMLSFPYNSSSPILYYNKDIFEKAGLDVDNPPKTWNEVWDAARQIKDLGCGALRLYLDLADLDPHREFRRLERRALRAPTRTAWPTAMPSCRSTRRSTSTISRRWPISPRTAPSSTAAAPRRPSRSSSPANAASSPNARAGSAISSSRG